MSGPNENNTNFGDDQRVRRLNQSTSDGKRRLVVDQNSETWAAVKQFCDLENTTGAMSVLRSKQSDDRETHYARGGLDMLDSLLDLGKQ